MNTSKLRGRDIEFTNGRWIYSDTKEATVDTHKDRSCFKCGKIPTAEGHDYCLGALPGVRNACCGHGDTQDAYVQFLDGFSIYKEDAIEILNVLKKYKE